MRVVLDTNVLVSALLLPQSLPDRVVTLARQGRVQSVTSKELLEELRRVLKEKLKFETDQIESALELIFSHSEIVTPAQPLRIIRSDPSDNRVLECALEGLATAIVTGDHHLLELGKFRHMPILSPRQFLSIL